MKSKNAPISVLSFFCYLNQTLSCGITIYRAYNNNDTTMIVFVTIVYIGSFLLDYWTKLYKKLQQQQSQQSSSKGRNIKIATWVLLSSIMLGFAFEFSTFMSFIQSSCFFVLIIAFNALVFYVYFIWEDPKGSTSACFNDENVGKNKENKTLTGDIMGTLELDNIVWIANNEK